MKPAFAIQCIARNNNRTKTFANARIIVAKLAIVVLLNSLKLWPCFGFDSNSSTKHHRYIRRANSFYASQNLVSVQLTLQPLLLIRHLPSCGWDALRKNGKSFFNQMNEHDGEVQDFESLSQNNSNQETKKDKLDAPLRFHYHHTAIKTRDIQLAIQFYSLFRFRLEAAFRAGPARAAWLTTSAKSDAASMIQGASSAPYRIELIEVPRHLLQERDGIRKRAIDFTRNESLLGFNHVCLDVTSNIYDLQLLGNTTTTGGNCSHNINMPEQAEKKLALQEYLQILNQRSVDVFGKTLNVALKPRQQIIGNSVYELAFIYDADGTLLELLCKIKDLDHIMSSGWEPWNGKGFIGK